ncbi:glycoside hydrolase family 93 protein [Hypoxylon fragiforme]|uniref:glycoside hydrolase family 93 protein n=1 Tax=Hypoxylon fragiforme TaxID=63214 RepID=UPI0020C682E7|nr:glycoside hydrolase family 93 protein [Hypoxylon fragiforme]KAI2604469.1 glycoside hydrolase family 93 protein [Hypoxylon fragiforme]
MLFGFLLLNLTSVLSQVASRSTGGGGQNEARAETTIDLPEISSSIRLSSSEVKLNTAGAYPRLAKLSDGSILSVQTLYNVNGSYNVLQVSKSTDNGQSFDYFGEIVRGAHKDIDNGFLLELPQAQESRAPPVILAAYRNHDMEKPGAEPTYYRITVSRSEDGGRTWKDAVDVVGQNAAESKGMGLWEPSMRVGADGGVQLMYSGEITDAEQEIFRAVSHSEGREWSEPVNLHVHSLGRQFRDGMQSVVAVKDQGNGKDTLVMVVECKIGWQVHVDYMLSYDDGASWWNRSTIYDPKGADRSAGAPQIANFGDGVALTFMTDEDTTTVDWPKNSTTKALFSNGVRDGKMQWSKKPVLLDASPSWWPGLLTTANNEVMAVYGHDGSPRGKVIKTN